MQYSKYTELRASEELDEFEFVSNGPNGDIIKKVQFSKTDMPGIYNLGFGDKMNDGSIDDNSDSKNGDRDKILATICNIIYLYTNIYPERSIVFLGSNLVRTRLYRMAIAKNYEELSNDFHIFVLIDEKDEIDKVPFYPNLNCLGFLINRKSRLNLDL